MSSVRLPVFMCVFLDFPEKNRTDCDRFPNGTSTDVNCFTCPALGKYLFGGLLDDHGSPGHIVSIVLWITLIIMSIFGAFANGLIISILRKRSNPTSFDLLLYVLATFDLIISVSTLFAGTALITHFENWDRGPFTITTFILNVLIFIFARSVSAYMTVFITIERYLVITNPLKSGTWFSVRRTKLMSVALIVLAIFFNLPRWTSVSVGYNYDGQNVPSLQRMKYIIFPTTWEQFWYKSLRSAHYVDSFAPFPLLIVFNVLLFYQISKFIKMRKKLTQKQKLDIRAARMFIPVVVVLFLCNIQPTAFYLIMRFWGTIYREFVLGWFLSVAINSAANLPIYYARGSSFRNEIRSFLPKWMKPLFNQISEDYGIELTGTVTSTGDDTRDKVES